MAMTPKMQIHRYFGNGEAVSALSIAIRVCVTPNHSSRLCCVRLKKKRLISISKVNNTVQDSSMQLQVFLTLVLSKKYAEALKLTSKCMLFI